MRQSKITALPGENELTPAQARLITCLLTGCSVRTAAREAGIVEKSAFRYLGMPHVKKALDEAIAEIMKSTIERQKILALEGLETIVELMKDRENPAQVRLKAAEILARRITEMKPEQGEQKERNIDWSIFEEPELAVIAPIFEKAEKRKHSEAEKEKQA